MSSPNSKGPWSWRSGERLQDHHPARFGEDHQGILWSRAPLGGRGQPGRRRTLLCHQADARRLRRIPDDALYALRKAGVFYEEWTGGHGWERYEVPAGRCPRISEGFLEEERASLPPFIFRQEYECSFEETEDQVFTTDMIDRALTDEVKPLFLR